MTQSPELRALLRQPRGMTRHLGLVCLQPSVLEPRRGDPGPDPGRGFRVHVSEELPTSELKEDFVISITSAP